MLQIPSLRTSLRTFFFFHDIILTITPIYTDFPIISDEPPLLTLYLRGPFALSLGPCIYFVFYIYSYFLASSP